MYVFYRKIFEFKIMSLKNIYLMHYLFITLNEILEISEILEPQHIIDHVK
jgi:hypothetical protein